MSIIAILFMSTPVLEYIYIWIPRPCYNFSNPRITILHHSRTNLKRLTFRPFAISSSIVTSSFSLVFSASISSFADSVVSVTTETVKLILATLINSGCEQVHGTYHVIHLFQPWWRQSSLEFFHAWCLISPMNPLSTVFLTWASNQPQEVTPYRSAFIR